MTQRRLNRYKYSDSLLIARDYIFHELAPFVPSCLQPTGASDTVISNIYTKTQVH
jgi:hypothetical protein